MDKQKIVLIAVLLSIIAGSCKSELSKERSEPEKEIAVAKFVVHYKPEKEIVVESQASNNQDTTQTIKFVIDDEFIFGVINNDLPISYFKSQFNQIEKKVIQNQHYPALSDTIMIFSNGKDTAKFYVSAYSNIILQEVVINSGEIVLNDSIKVGVDDEVLKRMFNINAVPDSLVVENFENSGYFLFTFREGRINKIAFKSRYFD